MSQPYSAVPVSPTTAAGATMSPAARTPRHFVALMGATFAAAALTLGAMAFGPASPAHAHDQLVGSEVVEGADGNAEAVRLSFSNNVIEVGTEFVLTSPDGDDVRNGAPEIDGPDVTQPFVQGLTAGDYAGAWRVVSSDGHPIDGVFTLTIEADGSAELQEGAGPVAGTDDSDDASESATASAGDEGSGGTPVGALIGVGVAAVAVVAAVVLLTVRRRSAATASDNTNGGAL